MPEAKPHTGGKPAHVPTDKTREFVRSRIALGMREDVLADLMGIDPKTLRKHYRFEISTAAGEANAVIAGKLFEAAKKGDGIRQMFWLKTRAGWSEKSVLEVQGGRSAGAPNIPDDMTTKEAGSAYAAFRDRK